MHSPLHDPSFTAQFSAGRGLPSSVPFHALPRLLAARSMAPKHFLFRDIEWRKLWGRWAPRPLCRWALPVWPALLHASPSSSPSLPPCPASQTRLCETARDRLGPASRCTLLCFRHLVRPVPHCRPRIAAAQANFCLTACIIVAVIVVTLVAEPHVVPYLVWDARISFPVSGGRGEWVGCGRLAQPAAH